MKFSDTILSDYLKKINFFSAFLLVFALPFYKPLLPWISFFWAFTWLIDGGPVRFVKGFPHSRNFLIFISLFVMYIIAMLYTENQGDGWFNIEVKLSLFFFPLIFSSLNNYYKEAKKDLLWAFVFGNIAASLVCLFIAAYNYFVWDFNTFYYAGLSVFHHPTYFGMYIGFSILVVINTLYTKNKKNIWLYISLIVFFLVMVFLLSSKAGIITAFLIGAGYLIFSLFARRRYFGSLLIVIFAGILFVLTLKYNDRFMAINKVVGTHKIDKNDEDSNVARLMVWKSALQVGIDNIAIGVGTGDTKDVLMEQYAKNGLSNAYHKKYNAHNEFLETIVTLGIVGFLILFLILGIPLYLSFRKKDFLVLFFILAIMLNFSFESMLNTIAGALFFSFFYGLLIIWKKDTFAE